MFKSYYKVVGAMEDRIKKEQRRLEAKQNYCKRKKKKNKKEVARIIKLSHKLDNMYFNIFK